MKVTFCWRDYYEVTDDDGTCYSVMAARGPIYSDHTHTSVDPLSDHGRRIRKAVNEYGT